MSAPAVNDSNTVPPRAPADSESAGEADPPAGAEPASPPPADFPLLPGAGGFGNSPGVDLAAILRAGAERTRDAGPSDAVAEHVEEIANDMLTLMRRTRDIETAQQSLLARIDQVQEGWSQSARSIAREVDTLRKDLLGEKRHSALIGVVGELMPVMDRLRTMSASLDPAADARMAVQLSGVLENLGNCLRRLGCEEFTVLPGAPFDAERMQCVSYVEAGQPGTVVDMTQPGFACGQLVLRRASVRLAAATAVAPVPSGDDYDE